MSASFRPRSAPNSGHTDIPDTYCTIAILVEWLDSQRTCNLVSSYLLQVALSSPPNTNQTEKKKKTEREKKTTRQDTTDSGSAPRNLF